MSREWDKFENDELFAMWTSYKNTEFGRYHNDPCCLKPLYGFQTYVRLTPMEIVSLVDDLMKRLEIKETEMEVKK